MQERSTELNKVLSQKFKIKLVVLTAGHLTQVPLSVVKITVGAAHD